MPELPEQKRERFKNEYGLDPDSVEFFVNNKDLSEYYEEVVSEFEAWTPEEEDENAHKKVAKLVANYLISDVKGLLAGNEFVKASFKITPENFAEFIKMIYNGEISSKVAKMVLVEMFNIGEDPCVIVDNNNWRQMSDDSELEKIIKEVLLKNPKVVDDFKQGKQQAVQFLIGQIMAQSKGKANPGTARELLLKLLTDTK